MVGSLITYVKCPFCPPRRGVLAVDVGALREVVGISDVDLNTERAPALVFDPDRGAGGPCAHVIDLAGQAAWEWKDRRGREQPGGCLEVSWIHPLCPSNDLAVRDRWYDFSASVLRPDSDHALCLRPPRVDLRAGLERCIPEVRKGRSWRLWLWGGLGAAYVHNPEDYYRQVGSAFRRYLDRRGSASP